MTVQHRRLVMSASLMLSLAAVPPVLAQEPASPPAEAQPVPAPPAETPLAETQAGPTDRAAAAKAPAPSEARVPPPPEGKGQVVFFRPSSMIGMALSFSVHEGDKGVGKLGNGSYFVHVADPGPHLFTIQSEVTDKLTLEIDAGETYYVKQTIGVGIVAGRPRLSPSEQGEFERQKLKVSTKKASDLKPKGDKAD